MSKIRKKLWLRELTDRLDKSQDGKCFYCDSIMNVIPLRKQKLNKTCDHFIPVSILTSNTPIGNAGRMTLLKNNLVFACYKCNSEKTGTLPSLKYVDKFAQLYDFPELKFIQKCINFVKQLIHPYDVERNLQSFTEQYLNSNP